MQSSFSYGDFFDERANVGYETLLYDCMLGDATLFQRADNIEASWAVVEDVLHPKDGKPLPVHGYAAGSDGTGRGRRAARRRRARMAPSLEPTHTTRSNDNRQGDRNAQATVNKTSSGYRHKGSPT